MQYSWAQGEETTNVPEAKPKSIFMNCNSRVPVSYTHLASVRL